jgi:sulfoxide reductase catalytic subunit YedY
MYVRYFQPFYPPTREEWRLEVSGLVERPRTFRFEEIRSEMPKVTREARLKCVECWSARRTWGGFTYEALAQIVRPLLEARYVEFRCADTYWEVLSTEELAREGVVFAYELDGALLPDEYGAPLRLLVPWKYGYKMPKAIVSMEFKAEGGKGYWPTVGPYTPEGDIQPGTDHPLDLGKGPRTIPGGEITAY